MVIENISSPFFNSNSAGPEYSFPIGIDRCPATLLMVTIASSAVNVVARSEGVTD